MDHFPTNWGRPVGPLLFYACWGLLQRLQRNDAFDAYGTYPIHQRPNNVKDPFAEGVQRTQSAQSHLPLVS